MSIMNDGSLAKKRLQNLYGDIFSDYSKEKRKMAILNNFISNLYYELENVKGIDYTKEKSSFNKDRSVDKYYGLSDLIESVEKEKRILDEYLGALDRIFNKIADPEIKRFIKSEYIDDDLLSRVRN